MLLNKISKLLNFKTSFKFISCGALVLLADFLFYDEKIGWTLGLFGLLLIITILTHNKMIEKHKLASIGLYASFGLTFALIENPNELTFCLYYLSVIFMVVSTRLAKIDDARAIAKVIFRYLMTSWVQLYRDNIIIAYANRRWQKTSGRKRSLIRNWLLPIGLSSVFIMLFAEANPIITALIGNVRWETLAQYFSVWRILFWLLVACTSWALIRPKLRKRVYHNNNDYSKGSEFTLIAILFNERSVLTSLILFNALFFMQNLMDIAFLWSGADLPLGMTHAQYAHKGAYPLIATALLTAVFVLIAFKPKSAIEKINVIRCLVYIWIGQNVFLVISSITRLMNYIEEFSLTYMRVSALIWMGLVAIGLILIVTRIYMQKSNKWLVNINAITLYATLYICCFVNFGSIIADYNVNHCGEITGKGVYLDLVYLQNEVGVDAIPALLRFEKNKLDSYKLLMVQDIRTELQSRIRYSIENWRTWTFRKYRLLQYNDSLYFNRDR